MPPRISSSFGNLRRKLAYEWLVRNWRVPVDIQLVDFQPRVLCMYTFKGHGTRIGIRLYFHLLCDMETYRVSSFKPALNRQAGDTFKVGHSKSPAGPDVENIVHLTIGSSQNGHGRGTNLGPLSIRSNRNPLNPDCFRSQKNLWKVRRVSTHAGRTRSLVELFQTSKGEHGTSNKAKNNGSTTFWRVASFPWSAKKVLLSARMSFASNTAVSS